MPDVIGDGYEQYDVAEQTLLAVGFTVERVEDPEIRDAPPGTVISQSPEPGEWLEQGGVVTLTVERQRESVVVPDVSDQGTPEAAAADLEDAGLSPLIDASCDNVWWSVAYTIPAAGETVSEGNYVDIYCTEDGS